MYYRSGTDSYAAAKAPVRGFMFTHQVAAFFCVK